jgi:citrate synthase
MMKHIKENVSDWTDEGQVADCLDSILRKKTFDNAGKLYGFGHAVYTISDPRAICLKDTAQALAEEKNISDEFNLYHLVERLAPGCFARVTGKPKMICANVDFYSGFVYECLGIPKEVYTPLFAMARVSGWLSHRIEEIFANPRIIRPGYKNVTRPRSYVDLEER